MKVWELMNSIKCTESAKDEILNWMVMNKICPLEVETELDAGVQPIIGSLAHKHCKDKPSGYCGPSCYEEYLMQEVNLPPGYEDRKG